MNTTIVAALIQEGSKLISMWLRNRPLDVPAIELSPIPPPRKMTVTYLPDEEEKTRQSTVNHQQTAIPLVSNQAIALKLSEPDSPEGSVTEGGFVNFNPKVAENVTQSAEPKTVIPAGTAAAIKTGCVPCVPPNTLILGNPSAEKINDIVEGTKVLDREGKFVKVNQTMSREYVGNLIKVTVPYQQQSVFLTPEHPVLVIKAKSCATRKRQGICLPGLDNDFCVDCSLRRDYTPEFIPAGELTAKSKNNRWTKMVLLSPRLMDTQDLVEVDDIPITADLMKLAGYYLSEGSATEQTRGIAVRFDFNKMDEQGYAEETASLLTAIFGVHPSIKPTNTSLRVCISSKKIGRFFITHFGKGAHNKKIPIWALTLPLPKQEALIKTYWRGDGSISRDNRGRENAPHLTTTTVSRSLAYGLRMLLHRHGILHSIGERISSPSTINSRTIKGGLGYILQVGGPSAIKLARIVGYDTTGYRFIQSHTGGFDSRWMYLPIKNVEQVPYQGPVMNLETESGTYCANGVIVHNCAIGHMGTCSGVINEAVRFARDEGMVSDNVINRVGICLDELNSMERVDLRPEMLQQLEPWEKALAEDVLIASRKMRHSLEAMNDINSLEKVAAETQSTRQDVWRKYIKQKMNTLTPDEQAMVEARLRAKLAELAAKEESEATVKEPSDSSEESTEEETQ